MSKFIRITSLVCGIVALCVAGPANATLVISATNTPSVITFDADVAGVFTVGAGTNAGGARAGIHEPNQFNGVRVSNPNREGGVITTGVSSFHQYTAGGASTAFGADSNGDSDMDDLLGSNQYGPLKASLLGGHTSTALRVSKEGDFASTGVFFRIQNNTGATVTDWTFAAELFYEESLSTVSTATFGYAVDNGTIATSMAFTDFGAAPAGVAGNTFATSVYSLDETVTTTGVADGEYIVLGFFDAVSGNSGSGIVIDDISITAVASAVPEPSAFAFFSLVSGLGAMTYSRRRRS